MDWSANSSLPFFIELSFLCRATTTHPMKKIFSILFILILSQKVDAQNSILWEVSGNGLTSPSYLMGTLKFIGEKEFYLPKEAVTSMQQCRIFAIEDQVDHKAQMELSKAVHLPKGKSLATELSADEYAKVLAFFASEFKISKADFERDYGNMIPLALSINMTRMSLGEGVKYYDIELLDIAKQNKLKTYSLEPIKREAEAIQAFPIKDQIAALMHSIQNFETQKSEYHKLEIAYLQGDLNTVFDYSLHPTEDNPVFIQEFYYKRNEEWMPKIDKMMHDQRSFIAVGVSHLEGERGLLKLLEQKGYTLKPITVTR